MRDIKHLPVERLGPILSKTQKTVALFDSAQPSAGHRLSYLFVDPVSTLTATDAENVFDLLSEIDRLSERYWICGYLSYEAAYSLEERLQKLKISKGKRPLPLGWFGVFEKPYIFDHLTGRWTPSLRSGVDTRSFPLKNDIEAPRIYHTIKPDVYSEKIEAIKRLIASGDTYQVNFTYDVNVKSRLSPFSLYRYLRENQPTPFCAYVQNEFGHVLSYSPELFFSTHGRAVTVKPMKGTAGRGRTSQEDRRIASELAVDGKNTAENIMIVDLLRNDLGRICEFNTVRVKRLFEVETLPTVHQMTSTVSGKMRRTTTFTEIFKSIFPCGSVTGAPKIRTMEIINSLETGKRGVYCGALGYISPKGRSVFSVPIRTLQRAGKSSFWRYRVGSGIVWDSDAEKELEECRAKCGFIVRRRPCFEIVETILLSKGSYLYLRDHLKRMRATAGYFGFPWDSAKISGLLEKTRRKFYNKYHMRIRILLHKNGSFSLEHYRLDGTPSRRSSRLLISKRTVDENDPFLFHKTTYRPWYLKAMERAGRGECVDMIFTNSKGMVTEGSMNNIFVLKDKVFYTPPVECGLLAGVLRKQLVSRGRCREKILSVKDLKTADAVYCGNSVRGLVRVYP